MIPINHLQIYEVLTATLSGYNVKLTKLKRDSRAYRKVTKEIKELKKDMFLYEKHYGKYRLIEQIKHL